MKDSPPPAKRRRHDAAFRAKALCLAEQSRSTQAAARALNIDPKRLYFISGIKRRLLPSRPPEAQNSTRPRPPSCASCGLQACTPRTTDATHRLRCAPKRLLDQPKPTRANQVWVSAITYLPLANGDWAYLCAYQDMVSKQVVGWHVMATMPEELITTALQRTFWAQPPTPDLLVHSDWGGQYCGKAYRKLLHDHQALRSQSRRGDCYDNAQTESPWSRLKTEVLEVREQPVFADLADAQASVADYFDYYNHERLHSSIDYQTPYHTHQQLLQLNALNCPA